MEKKLKDTTHKEPLEKVSAGYIGTIDQRDSYVCIDWDRNPKHEENGIKCCDNCKWCFEWRWEDGGEDQLELVFDCKLGNTPRHVDKRYRK